MSETLLVCIFFLRFERKEYHLLRFVLSQTLISLYFVVVPTQRRSRGLPVKRDKSELDSHLDMRRSKENRNHIKS